MYGYGLLAAASRKCSKKIPRTNGLFTYCCIAHKNGNVNGTGEPSEWSFVTSQTKTINKTGFMSKLRETFLQELMDIYDAEKQLVKALPKVAKAAEHEELKTAIESHLEETEEHVERVERVFEIIGETAKGKKCQAMMGLLEEGQEIIKEKEGDAALICAAQKIEHYEIASYGCLTTWARILGEDEAADVLEETLDEEKNADDKLTSLAESIINEEESQGEQEEESEGRGRSRMPSSSSTRSKG
jgi:ferritin-like metal-binding protein YciE